MHPLINLIDRDRSGEENEEDYDVFEDGQHGWLMAVGIVHLLIFWILGILATFALWKWLTGGDRSAGREVVEKTALTILQERYARGEIQRDEYEEKKRDLGA